MSQLELASQAGTTPRYASSVETARSRLVVISSSALDVPLRERNAMLTSAGLSPAFATRQLTDAPMLPARIVLDRVLRRHEPDPAWVVGREVPFLAANVGAETVFRGMCSMRPDEIVDLWLRQGPFCDIVENWPDVVRAGVVSLRRESSRILDVHLFELSRRAETHLRTVPDTQDRNRTPTASPVMCARLRFEGELKVTELARPFDMSLNAVSKHIKVLEQAGLLDRRIVGRDHWLSLESEPLAAAYSWIGLYQRFWERRIDALERLFAEPNIDG